MAVTDGPERRYGLTTFSETLYDGLTSCVDVYKDVASNYTAEYLCDGEHVKPQFSTMAGQCYNVIDYYCFEIVSNEKSLGLVPPLYIAAGVSLFVALVLTVALKKCRPTGDLEEGLVGGVQSDDVNLENGARELESIKSEKQDGDLEAGKQETEGPRM